ncbi:MAG: AAA family ATPase, partial [bacterium]
NFKYASRDISDDDALVIIEQLVEKVKYLIEIGDKSDNWEKQKDWLQKLIGKLWDNRGAYPGLCSILDYLDFGNAIPIVKYKEEIEEENEIKSDIFDFLEGKKDNIEGLELTNKDGKKVRKNWKLRLTDTKKRLLKNILPRFDIKKEQIEKILDDGRIKNNIYSSLEEIEKNPYLICEEFIGDNVDDIIPFSKIDNGMIPPDRIKLDSLIEPDDDIRLRTLCVDFLKRENKHSFIDLDSIIHRINERLNVFSEWRTANFNENYFKEYKDNLSKALIIREKDNRKYVYLKDVYEDERYIQNVITELINRSEIRLKQPITEEFFKNNLRKTESIIFERNPDLYQDILTKQAGICKKIFRKPVSVISGAAGTGKTTIIDSIIKGIRKTEGEGTTIKLLAPTGKATERIKEKITEESKISISTIHSLIAQNGWINKNMTLKKSGGNQCDNINTLIIDEASMIDLTLMATLFKSINWNKIKRLILIGDSNQIPPIGRGKVFVDIINFLEQNDENYIGLLEENIRQRENILNDKGNGIIDISQLYIRENTNNDKNKFDELLAKLNEGDKVDKDLEIVYWNDTDELEDFIKRKIVKDLEEDTGKKFDRNKPYKLWKDAEYEGNSFQIISPYRGKQYGIENLNLIMQHFINNYGVSKGKLGGIALFDKIIQTVNRPKSRPYKAYNTKKQKPEELEIYNGEIGSVIPLDRNWKRKKNKKFQVIFHRKEQNYVRFYSDSEVNENLELAYAISIHKSQGSEFDRVYMIIPNAEQSSLISNELIYTGITRAKNKLTLFVESGVETLLRYTRPEKSSISYINSSLFNFEPLPDELINISDWYEEGKIHQDLLEHMLRSKSEVIIANILIDRGIDFDYEKPLRADDGTLVLPDFTIYSRGNVYYWEHFGMMNDEKYKNHYDNKVKWYNEHFPEQLICTFESSTLSKDIENIINEKIFKKG